MKSTPIILLSLAATGLAAPVFSLETQPAAPAAQSPAATDEVKEFGSICSEMEARMERCSAAVEAVKDAASAAEASKVLREEMEAVDRLRKRARALFPNPDRAGMDPRIIVMGRWMEIAVDALGKNMAVKIEELEALETPCFGCVELQEAWKLYTQIVFNGMSLQMVSLLEPVVQEYKAFDLTRYEAWKAIVSVHDRDSADAASAQLAVLMERQDKGFQTLNGLLSQLPEDEVDDFCQLALMAYQELFQEPSEGGSPLPQDFSSTARAALDKLQELGGMEPAYYGSPDLQERAGNFIRMPR